MWCVGIRRSLQVANDWWILLLHSVLWFRPPSWTSHLCNFVPLLCRYSLGTPQSDYLIAPYLWLLAPLVSISMTLFFQTTLLSLFFILTMCWTCELLNVTPISYLYISLWVTLILFKCPLWRSRSVLYTSQTLCFFKFVCQPCLILLSLTVVWFIQVH